MIDVRCPRWRLCRLMGGEKFTSVRKQNPHTAMTQKGNQAHCGVGDTLGSGVVGPKVGATLVASPPGSGVVGPKVGAMLGSGIAGPKVGATLVGAVGLIVGLLVGASVGFDGAMVGSKVPVVGASLMGM